MPLPHFSRPLETNAVPWILAAAQNTPLCLYAGKSCLNPRAIKLSGSLHRFCDLHRMRHNNFQRAYQRRRQSRRDRNTDLTSSIDLTHDQLGNSPTTVSRPLDVLTCLELLSSTASWELPEDGELFRIEDAPFMLVQPHESADNPVVDDFCHGLLGVDEY